MSTNKPGTPISSPKIPKLVKLDVPSTPPASKDKKHLLTFLSTPEQPDDNLPFSPAWKRSNSGTFKSPDYKFNTDSLHSPYSNALLKTPRNSGYDSDERDTPRRSKVSRTPQYLSPGRRLFADDLLGKLDLQDISTQLKSKLSLALGKMKTQEKGHSVPLQLSFSDQSFTSTQESPTKKLRTSHSMSLLPANSALQRANLNLQTLQLSPAISELSERHPLEHPHLLPRQVGSEPLGERISIPSPDEESSAHNALLAAFSRLRRKGSRSSASEGRRQSIIQALNELPTRRAIGQGAYGSQPAVLPHLNVAFGNQNDDSEQEAVYSLMSLASPQSVKNVSATHSRLHSRLQSQNNNSPTSSTSSMVLPPIAGLINRIDHDETDVENVSTDEESA